MKVKHLVNSPLSFARYVATKRVIKQWADKFDLVYFGPVDQKEDSYGLVGGITLSAAHKDDHYTVGSFRNQDFVLVERQNILNFPGKESQSYRWFLLQVDLKQDDLPHVFIDANHHEEVFYANLFTKFSQFDNATYLFRQHDPQFVKHFKVFTASTSFGRVNEVLTSDITAMLAHHFHQFDYEIFEDRLIVYASNTVATLALLQEMMRVGIWLADQLTIEN